MVGRRRAGSAPRDTGQGRGAEAGREDSRRQAARADGPASSTRRPLERFAEPPVARAAGATREDHVRALRAPRCRVRRSRPRSIPGRGERHPERYHPPRRGRQRAARPAWWRSARVRRRHMRPQRRAAGASERRSMSNPGACPGSVRVPVLSMHSTSTRARPSMAASSWTSTRRRARRIAPSGEGDGGEQDQPLGHHGADAGDRARGGHRPEMAGPHGAAG